MAEFNNKDQEEGLEPAEDINDKKQEIAKQKANLESKLLEEESEPLEVKYPTAVKEENKLNLILIGPEKCGKSTVANYLA